MFIPSSSISFSLSLSNATMPALPPQENKARLEEELAKRRLELARRDEEIARLQAQGGAASSSVLKSGRLSCDGC